MHIILLPWFNYSNSPSDLKVIQNHYTHIRNGISKFQNNIYHRNMSIGVVTVATTEATQVNVSIPTLKYKIK